MMKRAADRRNFSRIPFKTEVELSCGTRIIRTNGEIDVSMSGLCIRRHQGPVPDPGANCRFSIFLGTAGKQTLIEGTGKIVRSEAGSIAVEFAELELDGYLHLRQLVLNNARDTEQAEREIAAHWGIKKPGA